MAIDIQVDRSKELTTFTGTGELNVDEITKSISSFYDMNPTLNALFDLNNASVDTISSSHVKKIAELVQKQRKIREGGRTAIVASKDVNFGLARMFGALATSANNLAVETRVFRDIKEASSWLTES